MIELSQETEALAQRLAAAQRVSVDDAIRQALEERARSTGLALPLEARKPKGRSPAEIAARWERMHRLTAEIAAMPAPGPRSVEEIVGDINAL